MENFVRLWLTLLLAGGVFVAAAQAQGDDPPKDTDPIIEEDGDYRTITFSDAGMPFEDFVRAVSKLTDRQFVFDPRKVQNKTIKLIGSKRIHVDNLYQFFQTLFITQDFAIVPLGPPGAEVLFIEDIRTSQFLKQRARFVPFNELESNSDYVGEIIATTIPLRHISVDKAQRALTNLIQEHRVGFVVPVEESNSLFITNFAPTVWMMFRVITAMDVAVAENQLSFEKISLEYRIAEDIQPIVQELIDVRTELAGSSSGGGARPARGNQAGAAGGGAGRAAPPAPKIISDPRSNSLLVYAVDQYMEEIQMLVASLDSEVTEPHSNIHIFELKNTNAEEMQQVLTDLLNQGQQRGTRPTGAGGVGGRNTGRNTGRGNTNNAQGSDFINIVADGNTNSLLITATKSRYDEIVDIIERLDKRRPQVLVQCAIVELSDTDIQQVGVELAQVEGGGAETRFFGGTAFGLSTIDTQSNLDAGGDGGNGNGGGGGTGGGTTTTSNFFDDLVRVPNLGSTGLVTGVFRNFVEVPLLVQLFKQVVSGNLVSVPSILVNDNREATITVGTEIPTTQVNQGQFSDQSSFGEYQEANLELTISPHISNDNYLRLDIILSVSAFTGAQTDPAVPPPRTNRDLTTNITVQSGKTVVIGGLTTDNLRETVQGVPLLSEIPVLGELFKNTSTNREKSTLYVFITPTILEDFEALERISYERKLEIAKLDGQIKIVDPDFMELELDDRELSIEDIESTGFLDLPRYRPTQPLQGDVPNSNGAPVKPIKSDVEEKSDEGTSRPSGMLRGSNRSSGMLRGAGTSRASRDGRRAPGQRPIPVAGGN